MALSDLIVGAQPKWPVYTESQPWEESYLLARVWWCGDDHCDCTQAQIELIEPNPVGRPWIKREIRWKGPFHSYSSEEPGAAWAELATRLDELEALGVPVIGPRPVALHV